MSRQADRPRLLGREQDTVRLGPNGVDADATGTQAKPFKTIGAALAKITAEKRRIYICDGTYAEDVMLDATHSGVSLFGGIDFKGDGAALVPFTYPDVTALNGKDATGNSGGIATPYTCPGGAITTGAKGGDLGGSGASGTPGAPNPGTLSDCTSDVTGHAGMQPAASSGANTLGSLADTGWAPRAGTPGANGTAGQGGGGGYGNGGAGGGRRAGGCGEQEALAAKAAERASHLQRTMRA